MRKTAMALALALCALPVCGQTLREVLDRTGIPTDRFPPSALAETVNATSGKDGSQTYVAYVIVDAKGMLTENVALVRYDSATSEVISHKLRPGEMEDCCGSPLDIQFTRSYLLVSFHDNPSANTVLVAGKNLKCFTTLYGFDFRETAPDRVVYVENEVHFAAAHPVRVAYANLDTGAAQEIYPSKNDGLRAAFAEFHKEHMPP